MPEKMTALLSAYETLRPLLSEEKQHWQPYLESPLCVFGSLD